MASSTHFQNQFEKWAHSAWTNLKLTPPCDMGVICDYLNIEYSRRTLTPGTLGIYMQQPEQQGLVMIASALPADAQRKVWAHEIGHAVMSRGINGVIEFHSTMSNKDTQIERDCDTFAWHLLMPELVVRAEAKRLGHTRTNNRLGTLAGLFEVSKDDMTRRLRELKL